MAKHDPVAQTIAQLKALDLSGDGALEFLGKSIQSRSNLVAAKAAEIIYKAKLEQFIPQLAAAFDRFMPDGKSSDPGCAAKTAIAKALYELEAKEEKVFLRGIHHVQMEGVWGGNTDTAAELRGICALGLVRCNYRDVLDELAELLADHEAPARMMAARAIAYSENEAGAPLLRLKILASDENPDVLSECCAALLRLTPRKGVEFLARFDHESDSDLFEVALMALGESRLPAAFELLKERFSNELLGEKKKLYLLPMAMTRLPQAIEFLYEIIGSEHVSVATAAMEAMQIHRGDQKICQRIRDEIEKRGEQPLRGAFDRAFGSKQNRG